MLRSLKNEIFLKQKLLQQTRQVTGSDQECAKLILRHFHNVQSSASSTCLRLRSGQTGPKQLLHQPRVCNSHRHLTKFSPEFKDNDIESKSKRHYAVSTDFKNEWSVEDFERRLFSLVCGNNNRLTVASFKSMLAKTGLRESDPRLKECMDQFNNLQKTFAENVDQGEDRGISMDRQTFYDCITENIVLIAKAFRHHLVIPEFAAFKNDIDQLYWLSKNNTKGQVATYIPQLARYNPNNWAVSVCTVDGQRHSVGDTNIPFCLQSTSKPLVYALVMNEHSPDLVHQYVGHEPSGRSFNEISLDYKNKPHNPMVNSGAIVTCSLLKPELNLADRFDYSSRMFKRMTGGEYLSFNNAVFLSERESADRNFAIGYYLRENKCFPQGTNLMELMDFYFQQCSVEVTCDSASVIAATFANGGVCPITGDRILSSDAVRNTLSLMHSCGMYDYSGQFAFKVGLPAKSGVSGAIMLVVPNVMGITMWSPLLDNFGNSCRGIQFCQDFVSKFNFHKYDDIRHTSQKVDPRRHRITSKASDVVSLLFGAFNGDVTAMRRYALLGMDMEIGDYDGRTALHVAAAEGHENVVKFLLEKCKVSPLVKDRWGFMPLDDARRFNQSRVVDILEYYTAQFMEEEEADKGDETEKADESSL